ncbi:hypothetical protein [Nocardia huaxiensis]|uniref:hypothetical protein n=1 Tax=Nocardia huaxiensis TaxID=2755382 RepID=UPI001E5FCD41|nr:hypothetical protein [Nocardia huaxiensis]UFS95218.1 hypothetical protein LPY97_31725 [Nocardia huaxiensis]
MRKTPQQKKALSYARDRRNDYGENDKSSRRNIRRNKREPNRSDRHREHQVLSGATGTSADVDLAERVETELQREKSRWMSMRWRKWRDAPLGETVEYRLRRRARLGIADPATTEARLERMHRHFGR